MYTVDYFIDKFKKIPDNEIGYSQPTGCAYGQCRRFLADDGAATKEGRALTRLMMKLPNLTPSDNACFHPYDGTPARINNGEVEQYMQPTPKQRILAALYDIKKLQQLEQPKVVKEYVVVHVADTISEQTKELILS